MAGKVGRKDTATIVAAGSPVYFTNDPNGLAAVYKRELTPRIDSIAEMRMDKMNIDAIPIFYKWINKGQGSICGKFGLLKDHCPDSCVACADYRY